MSGKYRSCVGMMILNDTNKILVGRRLDHPSGFWQMPQGGIDDHEKPEEAVWREMMEEIGTNNAKLIKSTNQWYKYQIPKETLKTLPWGEKYIGQKQLWFACRFVGNDTQINIKDFKQPEFCEWKWINPMDCLSLVVPFKKVLYEEVLDRFKIHIQE